MNKAFPKDNFSLLHIDTIIDSTTVHEMLSFMDDFLGSNHIRINKEDHHKETFTMPWGTFFWVVIHVDLKNAGDTYQRTMITMFHELIHKFVEVYIDDILFKFIKK